MITPPYDFSTKILTISDDKTVAIVHMECGRVTYEFNVHLDEVFGQLRVKEVGAGMKMCLLSTPATDWSVPYECEIEHAINQNLKEM